MKFTFNFKNYYNINSIKNKSNFFFSQIYIFLVLNEKETIKQKGKNKESSNDFCFLVFFLQIMTAKRSMAK